MVDERPGQVEHDPPVRSQTDELKTCLKKWGWVVDWWCQGKSTAPTFSVANLRLANRQTRTNGPLEGRTRWMWIVDGSAWNCAKTETEQTKRDQGRANAKPTRPILPPLPSLVSVSHLGFSNATIDVRATTICTG